MHFPIQNDTAQKHSSFFLFKYRQPSWNMFQLRAAPQFIVKLKTFWTKSFVFPLMYRNRTKSEINSLNMLSVDCALDDLNQREYQSQEPWCIGSLHPKLAQHYNPFSLDDNFANVCWMLKRLILTHTVIRLGIWPPTFMLTLISIGMNTTLHSWCITVICFHNSNCIFISFVTGLQFQKTLLVDFSLPNIHVLMIALPKSINKQMIRRHFTA